jgi:acetyl/propionyl-CoA carboxylase alpha subunit
MQNTQPGSIKLLVANRSEIACRVFQACREMGISTVAICAPGDEQARHLTYADEVVSVTRYLDIESVVAAARKSGSSLIHPGYGFLSERPEFADACEKAGITFVGPRAETMRALGEKIAAKELAEKAKVPTLPWARVSSGAGQAESVAQELVAAASRVGYPLLLKASAGGGGKGMRRVNQASELKEAAESASAEAIAAFGDGTLFLERLVENPRHIEVQVFGDGKGGGVHLYERECSLQRRHQKVWEEAPAPNLKPETRKGLLEAAMRLVREVKYRSAGTLEFLVDAQGEFYFLEMNTRLQVEHPVTEQVTGLDLVHLQIALALEGETFKLPEVGEPRGHAIEVRLYAEDPAQGFAPTPGTVEFLRWPTGTGIRVESGIEQGQTIGTQFDSMLGKLVVHAPTRDIAVSRMRFALEETVIHGMGSNQRYLWTLSKDPEVIAGRMHTGYLGSRYADFAPELSQEASERISAARAQGGVALGVESVSGPRAEPSPWFAPIGGGSK